MPDISLNVDINAPRESVWAVITDIENAAETISGIKRIEILVPGNPLVGLKWRETREMFGKEATEVMWIQEARAPESYHVRASSHGSDYFTDFYLSRTEHGTTLTMAFTAEINSVFARIVNILIGWMFKKATIKAIQTDLEDIKKTVETSRSMPPDPSHPLNEPER